MCTSTYSIWDVGNGRGSSAERPPAPRDVCGCRGVRPAGPLVLPSQRFWTRNGGEIIAWINGGIDSTCAGLDWEDTHTCN